MKRRCEPAAVKLLLPSVSILQVFQLYFNVHCHSYSGSVTDVGLINDSYVKETRDALLLSTVPLCARTQEQMKRYI